MRRLHRLVDGRRIYSCLTLAVMKDGARITTIEGLAQGNTLHPLQQAFIDHDAFQCGYCTPGQICSAVGLIAEGKARTADEIRELMSGNICRCGAYPNIVAAIEQVMSGKAARSPGRPTMNNFEYTRASDVADAVRQIAADPAAKFIAGGTNLIDLMKENVARPSRLIDITRLPLNKVEETEDGGLRIGALVPNSDLAYHPQIEARYPLLGSAILAGASQQLRNMAIDRRQSAATNALPLLLRHRPRPAISASRAAAARRSTASTACMRSWERASTASPRIPRTCAWRLLLLRRACWRPARAANAASRSPISIALPGDTPQIDSNLRPDEIITAIELPPKGFAKNYTYLKIRDRLSYAFALVSVAVGLDIEGDTIKEARLALGGVAHKPWRDREAEAQLQRSAGRRERTSCARPRPCCETRAASATTTSRSSWRGAPSCARWRQAARGTPQSQADKRIK